MEQPFLTEETDVEINAVQSPQSAYRIRAILEDARRQDRIRRLKKLRQIALMDIVIELLVVEFSSREGLFTPPFCYVQPRAKTVNGIHRTWIIDMVRRNQRCIERAGTRRMENLIGKTTRIRFPNKDAIDPEILRTYI